MHKEIHLGLMKKEIFFLCNLVQIDLKALDKILREFHKHCNSRVKHSKSTFSTVIKRI